MQTTSLIVPMNLTALCVSPQDKQDGHFGSLAVDFQKLGAGAPYLGHHLLPRPFDGESLPAGIHLHWALPDALAHGEVSDQDKEVRFRPAPNRFLVVRFASSRSPDTPAAVRAWVVESDSGSSTPDASVRNARTRAVPLSPELKHPLYEYKGRVTAYSDWKESDPHRDPSRHTALGYGTETYAAAYPHCPNVFGFFDPFDSHCADGLYQLGDRSFLSYQVIGWHSDNGNGDPVARETARLIGEKKAVTPATLAEALKANYHWSYDINEQELPARALYVGQLISLAWDPAKRYLAQTSAPVDVALGGTTAEALSALLASKSQNPASEMLLNELQYDLLGEYGLDGESNLRRAVHQRGFTPVSAGHDSATESGLTWIVKRNNDDITADAELLRKALPDRVAKALQALNSAQSGYDTLGAEVAVRRRQVFADWVQYISRKGENLDVNNLVDYLNAEIEALATDPDDPQSGQLEKQLEERRVARDQAKTDLTSLLADKSVCPDPHKLEPAVAPRFYQPTDPVILLSGPDVNPSYRYGGDGRFDQGGNLICRLSSDITREITIGNQTVNAQNQKLPRLPVQPSVDPASATLAAEFAALVAEAVFLDHRQAHWLASSVSDDKTPAEQIQMAQYKYIGYQTTGPLIPLQPQTTTGPAESSTVTETAIKFTGVAPSLVGFVWHEQPWIPLILQWEAIFDPVYPVDVKTKYSETLALDDFELDGDTGEMTYKGKLPPANLNGKVYRGMVSLTNRTEINLTGQIDTYLKNHPLDPANDPSAVQAMKRTLAELRSLRLSMMAQAMGGFHQQLQMRSQSLQLPVFDPSADPTYEAPFVRQVAHAVGAENDAAALPAADYNPLRVGMLRLTRLRLLDAFGQVRDIGVNRVILSKGLQKPDDVSETRALLPLRIAQPARLSFRYRSASDDGMEMDSDPASSPVFGWVLLNRLDNALAIYSAAGTPIGSFNLHGPTWQGTPGPYGKFENSVADSFKDANHLLSDFALNLGGGAPQNSQDGDRLKAFNDFLSALLDTIDHGAMGIVPDSYAQDQGLSLLMGRPLALVRADLRLDLHGGLPAVNQSAEALDNAVKAFEQGNVYDYGSRDAAQFDRVRFPVRLGDAGKVNDGLVGYFVESPQKKAEETYGTFYSPHAQGNNKRVRPPEGSGALKLALADQAPVTVTMLIDPRAPVHLSTGILPAKSIAVPPSHFADALKRIAVTFLTAPVLGGPGTLELPVPNEAGHAWSWLTLQADPQQRRQWQTQDIVVSPNPRAAFSAPASLSEGWLRLYPADTSSHPPSEQRPKPDPSS
jgi:hypothetical protein